MQTSSPTINGGKVLNTRVTNLTPFYVINSIIAIAIMVGFKYVFTPVEPLTPLGMEILGVFLGVMYGWLIVGDIYWPSLLGLVFLGLSEWTTVPNAFRTGFGHNNVMLMLFFFLFTNIINAAGITEYIARWITSRKFAIGKPYVITLLIFIASMVLYFMVTATAAALIMFPLVIEISKIYGLKPGNKWTSMVLIGLIVTSGTSYILLPYKSLPLVVFSSYEALGGEPINMAKYMFLVIVVSLLMLIMVFCTVKYIAKPDVSAIASHKAGFKELPKLTTYQKSVLIFFVITITLVMIPNFVPTSFWLSKALKTLGTPGIMAVAVMIWYGLRWKEGKSIIQLFSTGINWGVIFILAFALTVAAAVSDPATGIQDWLTVKITPLVEGKSPFMITFILCIIGLVLTQFCNNQSIAAIVTPILLSIAMATDANIHVLLSCLLLSVNAGFCTPPASATASILFGTVDWVPGKQPYIYGLIYAVYTVILCFGVMYPLGNLIF